MTLGKAQLKKRKGNKENYDYEGVEFQERIRAMKLIGKMG